jgi:hypothetical protein
MDGTAAGVAGMQDVNMLAPHRQSVTKDTGRRISI